MSESDDPKVAALRAALAASPENVPLLLLFAETCLETFRLDEAQSTYQRVLQLDAEHADARVGFARTLYLAGKISEATVRLEQLVRERPDLASAHALLGRLYVAEGSRADALRHYQTALSLDPNCSDPALEKDLGLGSGRDGSQGRRPVARLRDTTLGYSVADRDADSEDEEDADADEDETRDEADRPWGGSPRASGPQDFGRGDHPSGMIIDRERPDVGFAAVGGMEDLKEQIRMKILYPLENPELFRAYGKKIGGGVLLYGPPGCGKTLVSRATAGEINAWFYAIGLHDVLDAFIGESEKRLHAIFETARQNAPAVLFFDEIDALAADRRDLRQSAGRNLINQFLAELDGGNDANEGVLVLGATNAPWHVDAAFRRPGRFDRTVFVPPPDEGARSAIIEILARDKPVAELAVADLARRTREFSGADLKAVFDTATEAALETAMKQGRIVPLTTRDLVRAAKSLKPSTRAWFESAKNYALYANQDGHYDEVLEYLGIRK